MEVLDRTQIPYQEDGVNAILEHLTNLRGMRYMEFFLVGSVPVEGEFKGTCYNTSIQGGVDTAPQAIVEKLNPVELAKQLDVAKVALNPPRQWLLDWIDIPMGKTRDFGGISATWCAVLNMPKGNWDPFTQATIERKSKFGFNKGQTLYLLDDPEGHTWVMKSVTGAVDPKNTYESLGSLQDRLKLPDGWKARTVKLDKDLILIPESGVARILRDNLFNVYDITGEGYSNFVP